MPIKKKIKKEKGGYNNYYRYQIKLDLNSAKWQAKMPIK